MPIIDGKKLAEKIKSEARAQASVLEKKPVLAIVLAGHDPASEVYVSKKQEACREVGVESRLIRLDAKVSREKVLREVARLNRDPNVTAMLVQLPLPSGIEPRTILDAVAPAKDVDCLNSCNFGAFCLDPKGAKILPVTALAVRRILEEHKIKTKGRQAVVVGNSDIVGKPTALILDKLDATVTTCHRETQNLAAHTKRADILVTATGKKHLITKDMVGRGAVVIDVGIIRERGRIYGDVNFEEVKKEASLITPVPGGVGPVTVAMLLEQTVRIAGEF